MKKKFLIFIAFIFIPALVVFADKALTKTVPDQSPLTDQQLWALGASALLIERNHGLHNHLNTSYITSKNSEGARQLLKQYWDVNNRKDLLSCLSRLERIGHRSSFNDMANRLSNLSIDEYLYLLEYYKNDKETQYSIKVVASYFPLLGNKSISGWDFSRYICLCRWGYLAGYFTEELAWEKIMPVAKILQKTFDSWQDLGQNYLIGRQFWSYQEVMTDGNIMVDAYMRLIDLPSSPWNKIPWDLDLASETRKYSVSTED